ncbi:MAG: cyclase family protein [Vicinamibacterales bacterium]
MAAHHGRVRVAFVATAAISIAMTAGCGGAAARQAAVPAPGKVLDMTYPFDSETIYWPNASGFRLEKGNWGRAAGGYWYASNGYSAGEHGGTHLDAPIHFAEKGLTVDRIAVTDLIGPAVKVDVTAECRKDRNYLLQVSDMERWERAYGSIPRGAWVIMYSGIGTQYYPDRRQVLGTDVTGEAAIPLLSFPGFSPRAAEWLVKERQISGVAIDTPSIDYGRSTDFRVHQILYGAGKFGVENIANLEVLPDAGATLYVLPMLIKDGTGAPARVFAVLP